MNRLQNIQTGEKSSFKLFGGANSFLPFIWSGVTLHWKTDTLAKLVVKNTYWSIMFLLKKPCTDALKLARGHWGRCVYLILYTIKGGQIDINEPCTLKHCENKSTTKSTSGWSKVPHHLPSRQPPCFPRWSWTLKAYLWFPIPVNFFSDDRLCFLFR